MRGIVRVAFAALIVLSPAAGRTTPPGSPPSAPGQPSGPFSLALSLLATQTSWTPGSSIVASVTVGPVPVNGLVANVSLTDETTDRQFGGSDFQVCNSPRGPCSEVTAVPANSMRRVYIRPRTEDALRPGKYSGTIQLAAQEGRSDAVAFVINYTTISYLALGVALVATGTLLSLLTTVCIRNRLVRLQLLQTVAVVTDRLDDISTRLTGLTGKIGPTIQTDATINVIRKALTEEQLDKSNLLPRLWSVDAGSFANSSALKDLLEQAGGWVTALGHIVTQGFLPLEKLNITKPAVASPNVQTALDAASRQVDQLADLQSGAIGAAPDLTALDRSLASIVTNAAALLPPIGGSVSSAPTSERVMHQVQVLSFASWGIAALLTTLVGSYVLVVSHLDFGRPTDLWLCLFWGLGLPTVSQLSQATPASIASSIGVTLPK